MQKLVYLFDEKNKNFIGSEQAYIDPLETQIKGENVYLLPAYATFDEPPTDVPAGHVAVFKSGSWVIVTDNRGKKILKTDNLGSYVAESEEITPAEHILTDDEVEGLNNGNFIIVGNAIVEKPAPTRTEIEAIRRSLYIAHKDPITCQIESLKDEEQTPEIVAEIEALKVQRENVVLDIKTNNPYPEETA